MTKKQITKTRNNKDKIRQFLAENGEANIKEIANILGLSSSRTRKLLSEISDVVAIGGNRNRKYKLNTEK